ncbi:MAG: hypothetical protein OHK0012_06460 [Synechococcales cyanobacterium]
MSWSSALEAYSQRHPRLVLQLTVSQGGETDVILMFRGMSSSLRRATPLDLNQAVVADNAQFVALDIVAAPYQPDQPQVIQGSLTWPQVQALLAQEGLI